MTDDDHRRLADLLHETRAKVVVSGYPSPLYDELSAGWRRVDFDLAMHAAGGRKKSGAVERIWMNYEPPTPV